MPTLFASNYSRFYCFFIVFVNALHLPKPHEPMLKPSFVGSACKTNAEAEKKSTIAQLVTKKQKRLLITISTTERLTKELEQRFITDLERNQNIVHKVCTLYTNDQDAHNDLFQEITIQLWKAYPKFRGASKFSTWMYRVALNTAITLYRKKKKNPPTTEYESVIFKIKSDEYDETEDEQLQLMYHAVKQLGDVDKALVFLYLEDKGYPEIAETLGITEVNVRVKMNRIKTKLRTILNP